ncbi:MAG: hypothetical protein HY738_13735, partial [Bacteroidia bacterium]|nr:hypothetical protein [Bacteroidia bacterium]
MLKYDKGDINFMASDAGIGLNGYLQVAQDATLQINTGYLAVMSNGYTDLKPGSSLIIDAGGRLILTAGAFAYIGPGSTLRIGKRGKLELNNNSQLMIAQGARLVFEEGALAVCGSNSVIDIYGICTINNAVLTSQTTSGFWHGIIVHGDGYPGNDLSHQSYVQLKNGVVIENAECGIYVQANGLVKAIANAFDDDSHPSCRFINNKKALIFETVAYTTNKNLSSFSNCEFITDNNWPVPSVNPETFVEIIKTKGIAFKGCKFLNSQPAAGEVAYRGKGILCNEGGEFSVTSRCLGTMYPCNQWDRNVFEGLFYGIRASNNDYGLSNIIIKDAEFYNNHRPILLEGQDLRATILSNNFIIGPLASGSMPEPGDPHCLPDDENYPFCEIIDDYISYCMYLNGCTEYKIQENNFYNLDGTPYTIPGLIINSSGGSPNEVYNNYFNELSVATIAIGSNSSFWGKSNIPISYTAGLKYKCNEYGDNIYDIAVVNGEIASLQGEQEDDFYVPAGNTFEHNYINNGYDCEFYIYNSFPSSEFFYCYDP